MDWDFVGGGGVSVLYTIVYVLDIESWHFAFIDGFHLTSSRPCWWT